MGTGHIAHRDRRADAGGETARRHDADFGVTVEQLRTLAHRQFALATQPGLGGFAAAVGNVREIFVGTTRVLDPETGTFGAERSEVAHFARYEISVPPQRDLGEITFPRRHAEPGCRESVARRRKSA